MTSDAPGTVQVDRQGRDVRVRFTLPQESFTLPELRAFASYLVTLADENEPSPEVEALAGVLETCAATGRDYWRTAHAILDAGFTQRPAADSEAT